MVRAIPDILAQIAGTKRQELAALDAGMKRFEREAEDWIERRRDFRAAIESRPVAVIAEIKQASPSKGILSADFRPAEIARRYRDGGAAALSVLTDRTYFQGSLDDLRAAREAVNLPVLRKDFTIDERQVVEAAAHGADAILLIAALLDAGELRRLREAAARYRMTALVEVHDEAELDRALESGAEIIGVNNRDLRTFEVSLDVSVRLARRMPANVLAVAESGIRSAEDVARLRAAGYRGFLVGEHLMKSPDAAGALRELLA